MIFAPAVLQFPRLNQVRSHVENQNAEEERLLSGLTGKNSSDSFVHFDKNRLDFFCLVFNTNGPNKVKESRICKPFPNSLFHH